MTGNSLVGYANLLGNRKRWAKIGIVVLGICAFILLIAAFGLLWTKRDQAITGTTLLLVLALCVYPLFGLVSQLVEYRRLRLLLELLDVLQREAHARTADR